jgi:nitrite reductase/ring-hydroxylating ferredoxin subunit
MWHRVLPHDELVEGAMFRATIDGRDICLATIDGQVHAIGDTCPHRGASLSEGRLRDGCVTCPAHLWRFSFIDGTKQGDPRTAVAAYSTRTVDNYIEVDLPTAPRERSMREILLAHARGEEIS